MYNTPTVYAVSNKGLFVCLEKYLLIDGDGVRSFLPGINLGFRKKQHSLEKLGKLVWARALFRGPEDRIHLAEIEFQHFVTIKST